MTRKDYEAVAKVLRHFARPELPDSKEHVMVAAIADDLGDVFYADNRAFDSARFMRACGVIS